MGRTGKRIDWRSHKLRRGLGTAAVAGVWLAVLLGLALPQLRQARAKHLEIQRLEASLAEADQWIVAGLWLEKSVKANADDVNDSWDRLFPPARQREELFLDLASAADRARIEDLHLIEVEDSGMAEENLWLDRPDGDIEQWMSGEITGVDLDYYRVQARFRGDLRGVAAFLAGVNEIERAVSVHSLEMKPDDNGLKVEMKLDVYIRETTQS